MIRKQSGSFPSFANQYQGQDFTGFHGFDYIASFLHVLSWSLMFAIQDILAGFGCRCVRADALEKAKHQNFLPTSPPAGAGTFL